MKVILCDIEGTTTDISFVKDVLFPYARDNCKNFLSKHFDDEEIQEVISNLCELSVNDGNPIQKSNDKEAFIESIVLNVHQQIRDDRKTKELKTLQGKIWKVGFEDGSIKGHVYPEVLKNFEKWISQGYKIYIYSSGSVEAQKLLFANSEYGDMLKLISGHFDTNVGPKQESQSYKNILKDINVKGENVLFLSDIPNETIAAEASGMKVIILDRPNNPTDLSEDIRKRFKVVKTFDEIEF